MHAKFGESLIHDRFFLPFIAELRKRLIYCLLFFMGILLSLLPFAYPLYTQFSQPLCQQLPVHHALIATTLLMPLWIPCQLIFFALLLSLPFFFYQLWLFIKPALYPNEKSILAWFLLLNGGLFYSGIGLGYWFIFRYSYIFLFTPRPLRRFFYQRLSLIKILRYRFFSCSACFLISHYGWLYSSNFSAYVYKRYGGFDVTILSFHLF